MKIVALMLPLALAGCSGDYELHWSPGYGFIESEPVGFGTTILVISVILFIGVFLGFVFSRSDPPMG